MLLTRILTALILLPLIILAIIKLPPLYFSVIVAALMLVGAWEWSGLVDFTKNIFKISYVICVALGIFFSAFLPELVVLSVAVVIWVWALIAIINYQKNGSGAGFQFSILRSIIGFIVLIATWMAIVALKTSSDFGPAWLILVLCIIWGADVGGYFAGRALGKNALCSRVSPKKTWEGFAGGMILSVVVAAVGGLFLSLSLQRYVCLLILAFVTALFSVVGDLGVSLLKRMSGVKDSGKFFPGHGGMLDRLDSVAAGVVVFVVGASLLGL